jgi:predicted DNA-binding antitoxin AbrB/MazE fold protein
MSLTIEAIYEDGVLKLTQAIALPEGAHVSVVITPTETALAAKTPAEILAAIAALPLEGLDSETDAWLEADLVEDLPPYDWGEQGIPPGKQVKYMPGTGFVVEGGKSIGNP